MTYIYNQLEMKDGFNLPLYQKRLNELINDIYHDDRILIEASENHTTSTTNKRKLNTETIKLLEEWEHLKKKSPSKCEGDNKNFFFKGQLSQLIEPRAIPFLVFEQLSTWDPQGRLQNWTKNYKSNISKLPKLENYSPISLNESVRQRYSGEYRKELEFIRYVAAACAEYCGLWCERNALQDISFIASDYELAKEIIAQCNDQDIRKKGKESLNQIITVLGFSKQDTIKLAQWKWRHVASMKNKLGDIKPCHINVNLWRVGFVIISCKSTAHCYQLLGNLHSHKSVSSLDEHFKDFIGCPPPSGYKAIHTVVEIKRESSKKTIHVRFIVKEKGAQETWKLALENHINKKHILDKKTIRVFTPKGSFRDLPIGSTVLDFAAHIHESFVGRTDFAVINNTQRLALLDQLTDGDEIALIANNNYTLLPEGWENHVKTKSKYIRRKLKANMANQFVEKAHDRLGRIIPLYSNMATDVRDLILKVVVSEANSKIFNSQSSSHKESKYKVRRWLYGLGIKEEKENYKHTSYPFDSDIDDYKEKIFIDSLIGLVSSTTHFPKQDVISKKDRKNKLHITICKICNPKNNGERVIKIEGNSLVFHRPDSDCGSGGVIVDTKLKASIGQYFIFEISGGINDQEGTLSQILNILADMDIKITEVIGKHLGVDWVVIRIGVDLVSKDKISAVQKKLQTLTKIERILGPNDPKTPILENTFPPRDEVDIPSAMIPAPYNCGGVVKQDCDFYNRIEELGDLQRSLDYQTGSTFAGGKVFISGPLKTGKTSLAYKFLRMINQQCDNLLPLTVYYQAQTRDKWSDVENKLIQGLKKELREHYSSGQNNFQGPNMKKNSLEDLLKVSGTSTYGGKRIVSILIVDEVLIPFRQAHDAESDGNAEELENIKQFAGVIHNHPGTLLIWIGPRAPVNSLHIDLKNTLRAGEQIEVKPFSKFHSKELLQVNKLRWKYRIDINNHIINHIWKITNGNPFWLNHFGRKMWEQASQNETVGGMIKYTAADAGAAKSEILLNDSLFTDRIFPEGYYDTKLDKYVKCILNILFNRKKETRKKWLKIWVTVDEVTETMTNKYERTQATKKKVLTVFSNLVSMGGFDRKNNSIRIAAPLLADWIQYQNYLD